MLAFILSKVSTMFAFYFYNGSDPMIAVAFLPPMESPACWLFYFGLGSSEIIASAFL